MAAHSRSTGLVITESFLSPAMARRLVDGWIAPALCNSCDSEVGRDAHSANRVPDLHSSEWRRREGTPRLYQAVHDTSLLTVSINWQTDAIKDQVRNCKELIESKGWIVVEEYIKSDSGLSGATFETREDLQALLQAAKQSPRPLDCIVYG